MSKIEEEIKDCSVDDLRLILDTQKDLYSDEELNFIKNRLDEKILLEEKEKERKIIERLPEEIICPKCDMANPFSNEKCMYCEYKFDKSIYYEDSYYETDDNGDEADLSESSSYTFQYVISFIIPLIGYILGACLLSKDDEDEKHCGKACIIIGIISTLLAALTSVIASLIIGLMF